MIVVTINEVKNDITMSIECVGQYFNKRYKKKPRKRILPNVMRMLIALFFVENCSCCVCIKIKLYAIPPIKLQIIGRIFSIIFYTCLWFQYSVIISVDPVIIIKLLSSLSSWASSNAWENEE